MIESQHKKIKQRNKFIKIIALINSKGENTQKRLTDITNYFFQTLIYFFSFIAHTKVAKIVLSGEQLQVKPFAPS